MKIKIALLVICLVGIHAEEEERGLWSWLFPPLDPLPEDLEKPAYPSKPYGPYKPSSYEKPYGMPYKPYKPMPYEKPYEKPYSPPAYKPAPYGESYIKPKLPEYAKPYGRPAVPMPMDLARKKENIKAGVAGLLEMGKGNLRPLNIVLNIPATPAVSRIDQRAVDKVVNLKEALALLTSGMNGLYGSGALPLNGSPQVALSTLAGLMQMLMKPSSPANFEPSTSFYAPNYYPSMPPRPQYPSTTPMPYTYAPPTTAAPPSTYAYPTSTTPMPYTYASSSTYPTTTSTTPQPYSTSTTTTPYPTTTTRPPYNIYSAPSTTPAPYSSTSTTPYVPPIYFYLYPGTTTTAAPSTYRPTTPPYTYPTNPTTRRPTYYYNIAYPSTTTAPTTTPPRRVYPTYPTTVRPPTPYPAQEAPQMVSMNNLAQILQDFLSSQAVESTSPAYYTTPTPVYTVPQNQSYMQQAYPYEPAAGNSGMNAGAPALFEAGAQAFNGGLSSTFGMLPANMGPALLPQISAQGMQSQQAPQQMPAMNNNGNSYSTTEQSMMAEYPPQEAAYPTQRPQMALVNNLYNYQSTPPPAMYPAYALPDNVQPSMIELPALLPPLTNAIQFPFGMDMGRSFGPVDYNMSEEDS